MTITLGGVTLSDNILLKGLDSAKLNSSSQVRTIAGISHVMSKPSYGGKNLVLGSATQRGATMGFFCQSVVDQIKALEQTSLPQPLDYHGDLYTVLITSSIFEPVNINTPVSPTKSLTGQIFITEA